MNRRSFLKGGAFAGAALVADAVGIQFSRKANAVTSPSPTPIPLKGTRIMLPSGRAYWFYDPTNGQTTNIVVGLHGTGLTPYNCNVTFWDTHDTATTGWQNHAKTRGYALGLAEAQGHWNVGGQWSAVHNATANDMQYLADVQDDMLDQVGSQVTGTFIAGFSAGAAMAYQHATSTGLWDAWGMSEGWGGAGATSAIGAFTWPSQACDGYAVHGTGDTTVPIRGGIGVDSVTFAPLHLTAAKAPRPSKVVIEATTGGHATAGWMADRLWTFWTNWRNI